LNVSIFLSLSAASWGLNLPRRKDEMFNGSEQTAVRERIPASTRVRDFIEGPLARNRWLMGDQALVSAMNFLTTALLARMLGIHQFGVFSVLYIILLYLNTIPTSLNVCPMMSLAPQMRDERMRSDFLSGMAGYQYLISLGCCALMGLIVGAAKLPFVPWRFDPDSLFPFLLTVVSFQAQDWFRRICYVEDRGRTVFWNDAISYLGQVATFVVLWEMHRMNVKAAYYGIALTSLLAFFIGYGTESLRFNPLVIRRAIIRSWDSGKSLLMAGQLMWLGSQGIFLIVAAEVGVDAASGIRAAITLMGPVSVIYQLIDNVIPVRAARVFASSGERSLVRYLVRTGAVLAALVGVPVALVSLFARPVLSALFGRAYGQFAVLVVWQGVYTCLLLGYKGLVYYHRTVEQTAFLARSSMIVAIVSVAACLLLVRRYGATGGMEGLVIGQAVSDILLLSSARSIHRHQRRAA
jgi:O-antigen/teichoic acid export membrane protein